jgi:hypothetical protein
VQGGTLLASLAADTSPQSGWVGPAKTTSEDLNSLLQSDAFVRAVIAQSDLEPWMYMGPRTADETMKKVRSSVWTQTLGQNMVLIGAVHTSPAVAQQLSTGIIQNYIQWRLNTSSNEVATARSYFERLIPQYESEVRTAREILQAYLAQHPDPVRGDRPTEETFQIERLQAAVQEATQRLNETVSKAEQARLTGDRSQFDVEQTYSVVDSPQLPPEPSTSRRKQALTLAVFFLAGLLLSAVMVVGESVFDTTLRFPFDVQQKLGLPVLGVIPDVRSTRKQGEERQVERAASGPYEQPAPPTVGGGVTVGDGAQGA